MSDPTILAKFDAITVWTRDGERAVNKPLLLLYALGRWSQGHQDDIPFREVNDKLARLLKEFGPPRQVLHTEYPFWRMQKDGVWVVRSPVELTIHQSNTDPLKSELLSHNVPGGFSDDVKAAFHADSSLVTEIARRVLEEHFPESIHSDILGEVGLALDAKAGQGKRRNPQFRHRVLVAYEFRCAVCNFDLKIGTTPIALDAAHIRWYQADGPDIESNGLALCVLHHKTFDLGAFTLRPDGLILVSDLANGVVAFEEVLNRHHGKPIRRAQRPEWAPAADHLEWHREQVFKGSARHVG